MSRALVKETDGDALADDPLPRPPRQQPCYMMKWRPTLVASAGFRHWGVN